MINVTTIQPASATWEPTDRSTNPVVKQYVNANARSAFVAVCLTRFVMLRGVIHPESYPAAEKFLESMGMKPEDIFNGQQVYFVKDYAQQAEKLGVGEMTLRDIVKELTKPGRDPREEMPKPILRTDVLDMKDLKEGMVLKGTVRNVIDFGAFVDIGVHQDGLVHISQMTERYIKHPLEAVSVGDVVDVMVLGVDMKKKRISLTMKGIK